MYEFADVASGNPTFYADLTNPQSLNKYQYSYNNPLRWVDPDGHDPEPEPQDPKPVVPVPVPGPGGLPLPIPLSPTTGGPNDRTIIDTVKKIWELPDPYLYPISQEIGTAPMPTVEPVPVPPLVVPAPKVQPIQMARPIDKPNPNRHRQGKSKRTHDKDTRPRSGDKKPPGFRPRVPKRPQDMEPKPPKPVFVPPKPPKKPKDDQ